MCFQDFDMYESEIHNLLELIHDLVSAGSDIHHQTHSARKKTPLIGMLDAFLHSGDLLFLGDYEITYIRTLVPVHFWLDQLEKAGVDLSEYGREEHHIFTMMPSVIYLWWNGLGYWRRRYRLATFSFGEKPSDWHFCFVECTDNGFLDFGLWSTTPSVECLGLGTNLHTWSTSSDGTHDPILRRYFPQGIFLHLHCTFLHSNALIN
jgi:hypothetical protein